MQYLRTTIVFLNLFLTVLTFAQPANHIVIAEVYGGGGNSGSYYKYDYIVLYNPTAENINISGWSIQYASATASTWKKTDLKGIISANCCYVIQEKSGSGGVAELPFPPDIVDYIALATDKGKLALVKHQNELNVNNPTADSSVIDFVGYGNADSYEGTAPAPSPSNTESIRRKDNEGNQTFGTIGNGFDTDENSTDFFKASTNGDNPPLPVELVGFSGSFAENSIILKWQTVSEVENYGFEIQRAAGINYNTFLWEVVGFLKGSGNSNSGKLYQFEDRLLTNAGEYFYRLRQIDNNGSYKYSNIISVKGQLPHSSMLFQNYPNPFNPSTIIKYEVGKSTISLNKQNVTIKVYDMLGKEVATLVNEYKSEGIYDVEFNIIQSAICNQLSSGTYFYQLRVGNYTSTRKMLLMR